MVLRNDAADKTDELIAVCHQIIRHVNQSDLIIQLEHMLRALVQIHDIPLHILDLCVYFIQ